MTALAARLDPCANWFKLLARTKGRILWLFPIALLCAYLAALSRTEGHPFSGFIERRSESRANAPLLAQARGLNLDYEQVLAKPEAFAGKPVVWCVASGDGRSGFVSTRQIWPIIWTVPSDDLKSEIGSHGWCWNVLAVIEGTERGVVQLRPVERL